MDISNNSGWIMMDISNVFLILVDFSMIIRMGIEKHGAVSLWDHLTRPMGFTGIVNASKMWQSPSILERRPCSRTPSGGFSGSSS